MSFVDGLRYRVRALLGTGRHAREAERELRFHLDLAAAVDPLIAIRTE